MKLTVCSKTKLGVYHLCNETKQVYQMCMESTPVNLEVGDIVYTSEPEQDIQGFMWVKYQYPFSQLQNQ